MERLRSAHSQAERTLESRERAHRQRIRGLEEQVKIKSPIWNRNFVCFKIESHALHFNRQVHIL